MLEATMYTRICGQQLAIGEVLVCSREPTNVGEILVVKLYLRKIFSYVFYFFTTKIEQITVFSSAIHSNTLGSEYQYTLRVNYLSHYCAISYTRVSSGDGLRMCN